MTQAAPFNFALLVEDDRNLALAIGVALKRLGISHHHARTLKEARKELNTSEKTTPELIVLDRNLPDGDGLSLCESLRESGYLGTVLVLTAAGQTEDRVEGLNRGADDYLAKPFSWEELEARIRALARRSHRAITQAHWKIDESRLRILGKTGWIELTPLEFKLASHLIQAQGAIISRDDLLKNVWGFTLLPKTRTVDFFLSRLRKHFEKDPENPRHFLTVRGAGYRFEA